MHCKRKPVESPELTALEVELATFTKPTPMIGWARDLADFITAKLKELDEGSLDGDSLHRTLIALRELAAKRGQSVVYDRIRQRFEARRQIAQHDRRLDAVEPPEIVRSQES